jgi:hypothetical protein
MNKLIKALTISMLLSCLSVQAQAQAQEASIGRVQYNGSGCLQDEASVILSPDSQVMSIMFDNFIAEAGGEFFPKRVVKKCNLKIAVNVPANMRVSVKKIDYRGYGFVPASALMRFKSTYNFYYPSTSERTYTLSKQRSKFGSIDDEFLITHEVNNVFLQSKCGKNFDLNLTAEIEATTNHRNDEVYVSLDSADSDIESKVEYYLSWESCSGQTSADQRNSRLHFQNNSQNQSQSGGTSTPPRDELRRRARCRRSGRC